MLKKMLSIFLAAVFACSLLTACGSSDSNETESSTSEAKSSTVVNSAGDSKTNSEEFKLTYATTSLGITGDETLADQNTKNTIAFYEKKFKEKYPNATLELVNMPGNKYEDLFKVKYASGMLEDVIHMNVKNPKQYMKAGLLVDLSDQPWVKDALPAAKISCTYQGKWYTSTEATTVYGVFYNKKIFADVGISDVPKTWNELIKDCDAIKAKGVAPFVGGFKDNWILQGAFEKGAVAPFLQDKYPDPSINIYNGDMKWDGPEMKVALDKFTELITKGYFNNDCLSIGWDQSRAVLQSGKAAMTINGSWLPGMVSTMDLGFFPVPNDNGTQPIVAAADCHWGVNAKSTNVQAAIDLVNIMASKEGIETRNNNKALSAFSNTDVKQSLPVMTEIANVLKTGKLVNNISYVTASASNKLYQEILTKIAAGKSIGATDMADVQKLQDQDKATVVPPEN